MSKDPKPPAGASPPVDQSAGASPPCDELQQFLLSAHRPAEPLPDRLGAHLAQCPSCQTLRAQLTLIDELAQEHQPELPAGFELGLRRRLQTAAKTPEPEAPAPTRDAAGSPSGAQRRVWVRAALAAAAVVLLSLSTLLVLRPWETTTEERETYYRLHLAITSTEENAEVLFDVDLPEGVRPLSSTAAALGQRPRLRWTSAIRRGVNEFDLPLAARSAAGQVRVRLRAGQRTWNGTISLSGKARTAAITSSFPYT